MDLRQPAGSVTYNNYELLFHGLTYAPTDRVQVSLTAAGRDYIRHRRQVGTETFATLVSELPPDEAAALAAAVPALVRLREIDNQQRDALLPAR